MSDLRISTTLALAEGTEIEIVKRLSADGHDESYNVIIRHGTVSQMAVLTAGEMGTLEMDVMSIRSYR